MIILSLVTKQISVSETTGYSLLFADIPNSLRGLSNPLSRSCLACFCRISFSAYPSCRHLCVPWGRGRPCSLSCLLPLLTPFLPPCISAFQALRWQLRGHFPCFPLALYNALLKSLIARPVFTSGQGSSCG